MIIVILLITVILFIRKSQFPIPGLTVFLVLGAASNLYDRLKYEYVIDYIDLKWFTVFNLADSMIVVGAGLLIWQLKKDA